MEASMLETTLETRFMGLVFTISLMVTTTKELGMKVVSKAMAPMDLESEIQNAVNGIDGNLVNRLSLEMDLVRKIGSECSRGGQKRCGSEMGR
ncbi:uncharacterized protein LOC130497796 isoform X2 [Raphanus sativus]|nr:uncharacterized protein LOC130497796 isoform X2 [Raphanus sativus]